ncbi:alpha/beta hydrolase [Actinomycetospora sp. TBRC 11914]|uniref:alpha/beta hydrolase n=1 Tax=Actinomycetospora sp. TBRC 11914 TaxID=2729387 RepID=UPI00145C56ED|nr:alpha/beta hydrolase [Actinomycetospora sp. TBRC 11914]NMO92737.1 alpha/beta hydrolase [Actinomycetospora sp. TBRC 11914]
MVRTRPGRRRVLAAHATTIPLVAVLLIATALLAGASAPDEPLGGRSVAVPRTPELIRDPTAAPDIRTVFLTTDDGPLHASLWFPRDVRRPAPILVWVHGGGWITGGDLDRPADLRRWARAGWLVVSVEYGLARPGHPTWDRAGPQVACALGRLAEDAPALGGDPGRIVLAGGSAGGQLAVSVGYRAATGTQPSACGGPVPVPRAIAAEYPALDPVDGYEHGLPRADARAFKTLYTGGSPAQVPDRYRAVSGVSALSPLAPPTLVVAAGADRLVPRDGLTRFVTAARGVGVDASLVVVPGVGHAFDAVDGAPGLRVTHDLIAAWAQDRVRAGPPRGP